MSNRSLRVNELLKREISLQIHTLYRSETVAITITEVSTSPDLRQSQIFYSVIGSKDDYKKAAKFFAKNCANIRAKVAKNVILKYFPSFEFVPDFSIERGSRVINIMHDIEEQEEDRE